MEQELIISKPGFNNPMQSFSAEGALEDRLLTNAGKEKEGESHYFSSILKIPESQNFRYDISAISRHFSAAEQRILRISDFSVKGNTLIMPGVPSSPIEVFKMVNPVAEPEKNEDTAVKPSQANLQKSFRPVQKPEPQPESTAENFSDFFEDFECSMEERESVEDESLFNTCETPILTFVSENKNLSSKIDNRRVVILRKFIDRLQSRNANSKIYTCDLCGKNFNNHAALGGHKAKNHPHSSKSFIERKKTFELRKSERKKRDFLRNF